MYIKSSNVLPGGEHVLYVSYTLPMKVVIIAVLALLFILGGFLYFKQTQREVVPEPVENRESNQVETEKVSLILSSNEVAQGETLIAYGPLAITSLSLDAKDMALAEIRGRQVAVIGFDTRAKVGPRTLRYQTPQGVQTITFHVVPKEYRVTRIVIPEPLATQGVTSEALATSLATNDNVTLLDIVSIETERYHIDGAFVDPVKEWSDVGGFGTVREDQYGSIRHLGTDLDGQTGDPVFAVNQGVVVYASTLQNYGNSIIIDHGVGIFSIYLHLSEIKTQLGALVHAREAIGLIGNTGEYTLEPHLHFSIKVHGESVDPKTFMMTFNKMLMD